MLSPGGTIYDHDLFVGDVGHGFLGGPNGGGKTVWLGMNIAAVDGAVRRTGGTQIVLDVDESNHNTIAVLGGRYSTVQTGRSGVAPLLGFPDTRTGARLPARPGGRAGADGRCAAAFQGRARRHPCRRGFRHGRDGAGGARVRRHPRSSWAITKTRRGERLEPWCRGGELGWVFDGELHDIDFHTRLVGVDLTAVMDDKRVMPPLALLLLWMASDVMDGRRVVIWCEEAPAYMPSPAFAKPFKGIALRARKRNASFNAIAQQPSDMLSNEAGEALVKQARQMVLFANDKAVEADYRQGLGLTPAEFRAVQEGMFTLPFHSVLIKRRDGQSGVNRFDLSALPEHLNILSGTPRRVALMKQCLAKHAGDISLARAEFQSRILETAA